MEAGSVKHEAEWTSARHVYGVQGGPRRPEQALGTERLLRLPISSSYLPISQQWLLGAACDMLLLGGVRIQPRIARDEYNKCVFHSAPN